MAEPSEWQSRIEGEWHGRPSLFDATGTWQGYEDIRRSSVFEDGVTTYYMDGGLEGGGPLAGRFRLGAPFAFGVVDSDSDRVYTGPDFHGTGQPYGGFVDAHYYGPAGRSTSTPGTTSCPTARRRCTRPPCTRAGRSWAASTASTSAAPTTTPTKRPRRRSTGTWRTRPGTARSRTSSRPSSAAPTAGRASVGRRPEAAGEVTVSIELEPIDLLRTRQKVTWTGAVERAYTVEARRDGFRFFYEGPDAWGNAQAFGRANYPVLHFTDVWKVKGREFMIDARPGMTMRRDPGRGVRAVQGQRPERRPARVLTWGAA